MSQTKPLTTIERRDRCAAQNGAERLTPAQKRRIASKLNAAKAEPRSARAVIPAPQSYRDAIASGMAANVGGNSPLSGRKRYYADFMRSHYARARAEAQTSGTRLSQVFNVDHVVVSR